MKTTSITYWLVLLIAFPMTVLAQTPPAPTLTCTIEQPLNPPSGTPVSYDVSNLNFINLDLLIDTEGAGSLDAIGAVAINPPANNLPASYLVITATNSAGTAVPITAKIKGGYGVNGAQGYVIESYLPEDATTRASKEQAYINQIKTTDTHSPATAVTWINQNNAQALTTVDQIYTQSQVGAFTITVKYVCTKSGLWNGTVQGTSVIANVLNKGSQFDNLQ